MSPLWELTRARFLEFIRDPGVLFWVFGFPVLLALVLGIAFRERGPEALRVAVVGEGAEALVARAEATEPPLPEAPLVLVPLSEEVASQGLRAGRYDLLVRAESDPSSLRYRYDPSRPNGVAARLMVDERLQRAYGRVAVISVEEERKTAPGARYIDFLLPGLIGLNIMGSCLWGIGYAVVDARRRKLLKRFAVTPMNRGHFLASFALSRLLFLAAEVILLVFFGSVVFDVQLRGGALSLAAVVLLGTFAFSAVSLVIASRTDKTEVASGWMNFVQLPMWLFSGAFFDYSRFPEILHPFIRALPLTAVNDGIRAVMNEGASLANLGLELGVLALWGVVAFFVALRLFRWQ